MGEFFNGPNFSGRSAALMARLAALAPGNAFFIGPYAEAALSGLSSTVADEIVIYQAREQPGREFAPLDFATLSARKPPTLSGGEQVLLALHCFSLSGYPAIGIDTALEQLDPANRESALAFLHGCNAVLADNRLEDLAGWSVRELAGTAAYPCDLLDIIGNLPPRRAPAIGIENLSFGYPGGREIFSTINILLEPQAYRLSGANGAGKTTLFKLLAGVLAPVSGHLTRDGAPYAPWREGNRIFAFATQNPDHQWCGATLGEDLTRRRRALTRFHEISTPDETALAALAALLGIGSLDQHLYELPLVARKRLSWMWPFTGALPWIMLDEPTIGQDRAMRAALSAAINTLAALGHGVLFITHDDAFAGAIRHRSLRLADATITSP